MQLSLYAMMPLKLNSSLIYNNCIQRKIKFIDRIPLKIQIQSIILANKRCCLEQKHLSSECKGRGGDIKKGSEVARWYLHERRLIPVLCWPDLRCVVCSGGIRNRPSHISSLDQFVRLSTSPYGYLAAWRRLYDNVNIDKNGQTVRPHLSSFIFQKLTVCNHIFKYSFVVGPLNLRGALWSGCTV